MPVVFKIPQGGNPPSPDSRKLHAFFRHPAWTIAGVILIAFNLRPTITGVGPLISTIQRDFGLSGQATSLLNMLPVLCLGLFAPLAPKLARRFGPEVVLFVSLLVLTFGTVVRSFGVESLYVGTVIIGAAISILGVLCPVVIKRFFPDRVGLLMGIYSMVLGLGASISAALALPLTDTFGGRWEGALVVWALPAALAAVVFASQLFRNAPEASAGASHFATLIGQPLAWQVTGFLALVSSFAYAVFGWAPSILQSRGLDAETSGYYVSLSYLGQMVTGFVAPMIAARLRRQRLLATVLVVTVIAGLMGLIHAPVGSLLACVIVLGLGQGGAFALALAFILLRSGDSATAVQLSSLAQCVGYIVASLMGPYAVGALFYWSGSWPVVSIFFGVLGIVTLLLGLGAGRDRTISAG
jgi:MFS transporter, CP family, cyanate transporter